MIYCKELTMAGNPNERNNLYTEAARLRKKKKKPPSKGLVRFCRNNSISAFRFFIRDTFCWPERTYLLTSFWIIVIIVCAYTFLAHLRFTTNATKITIYPNYVWNMEILAGRKLPSFIICFKKSLDDEKLVRVLQRYNIPNTTDTIKFFNFLAQAQYRNLITTPMVVVEKSHLWKKILVESANMDLIVESQVVFSEAGLCFRCTNCSALTTGPGKPFNVVRFNPTAEIRSLCVVDNTTVPEWDDAIPPPSATEIYPVVKSVEVVSSRWLHDLMVSQRSCMFSYERVLKYSPIYRQKLCMIECRAMAAMRFCHCIPHFVAQPESGDNVCTLTGMYCIAHLSKVIQWRKPRECDCEPDCERLRYYIMRFSTGTSGNEDEHDNSTKRETGLFLESRKTVFTYNREIEFGIIEYLVSIGGIAGFFLGASVLSAAELLHALVFLLMLNYFRRRFS